MQSSIKVKGTVYVDIKKPDGQVVSTVIDNIVTTIGKEFFAAKIFNNSYAGSVTKIGIGAKNTAQTINDTIPTFEAVPSGTPSPITKAIDTASSAIESSPPTGANTLAYITTFTDTTGDTLRDGGGNPVSIKELALIGTNNSGDEILICRTTFDDSPPVTEFLKNIQDVVTITWKLTFN